MRLTCQTLADDVAPAVLCHINISAKEATTIEEVISDLQFLTNPERAAVNCSSKITFGDFSSIFPDSNIDKGNVDVPSDHVRRLSEELLTVLTSFKFIQTVKYATFYLQEDRSFLFTRFYQSSWQAGSNDPLWLEESIWKAIGLFPNLRHLKIDGTFLKQPLGNFESLNALESINIFGELFQHKGALFLSLSKLYASSLNLNSITIKNSDEYELYGTQSLQQLLSSSPRENPAHRLRYLAVSDVPIRLDEVSLSHLTHLTSFNLSSLPEGSLSSSPDDIWVAFKRSNIRLEELEVGINAVADSIIDYLSSFSGLKKLRLFIPNFDNQTFSDASAVKFWSESLQNHVDTIRDFSLRACYSGQWCFGRHNRSLVGKCTKLKQLTVSLLPEDIPTEAEDFDGIVCVPLLISTSSLTVLSSERSF